MFDATVFTHNRPRMDEHGITSAFFDAVAKRAIHAGLCSDEHFSVDGTLIESYASIKSFKPIDGADESNDGKGGSGGFKPRNAEVDFHGQKRSNKTHRSTTDPEARLYRKGDGIPAESVAIVLQTCTVTIVMYQRNYSMVNNPHFSPVFPLDCVATSGVDIWGGSFDTRPVTVRTPARQVRSLARTHTRSSAGVAEYYVEGGSHGGRSQRTKPPAGR